MKLRVCWHPNATDPGHYHGRIEIARPGEAWVAMGVVTGARAEWMHFAGTMMRAGVDMVCEPCPERANGAVA